MRSALILFFLAILLAMIGVTVAASLERGVFEAARSLWPDPWFRATLADAYFGFLTVYLWVAYLEATWGRRLLWLVLFLALGNIAIAGYLLRRLFAWSPEAGVEDLLLRRGTA